MALTGWNDLEIVLAVAETGSLNAAARRLRVNHTTVLRRLAAIERRFGMPLFERSAAGQALTPALEQALPALLRMAEAASEAERQFAGAERALGGTLRLATSDTLAVTLIGELVAAFRAAHPGIVVEMTTANAFANLTRREADVAIRPAADIPANLVGRRVGPVAFAIYVMAGHPAGIAAPWIGLDDSLSGTAVGRWMADRPAETVAIRVDSFVAARDLAAAGAGRAVLPRYLGDRDPRLRRLETVPAVSEMWVLTHAQLARSARIRAFTSFAFEHLKAAMDC